MILVYVVRTMRRHSWISRDRGGLPRQDGVRITSDTRIASTPLGYEDEWLRWILNQAGTTPIQYDFRGFAWVDFEVVVGCLRLNVVELLLLLLLPKPTIF